MKWVLRAKKKDQYSILPTWLYVGQSTSGYEHNKAARFGDLNSADAARNNLNSIEYMSRQYEPWEIVDEDQLLVESIMDQ